MKYNLSPRAVLLFPLSYIYFPPLCHMPSSDPQIFQTDRNTWQADQRAYARQGSIHKSYGVNGRRFEKCILFLKQTSVLHVPGELGTVNDAC